MKRPQGAPQFLLTADEDEAVLRTHGDPEPAAAVPTDDVLADMRRLFVVEDGATGDHLEDAFYDEDVLGLPPPSFVVDGWVLHGSFTIFWGKPGVYKTFLLNEMQRSVRRGGNWMEQPTRQGMTLMYQGEGLEQLQPRIVAWDQRYPLRQAQTMQPGIHLDRQPNLGTPEGCATVVRTVRAFERRHGKRVALLIFDPLVEFMPANDRIEDMDPVSRGLRALAQHLGCAVVAGHHSNAEGGRARGTDHLYMRCGAYVQMEALDDGRIGVFQHKIKSSARSALILKPEPYGGSVVLEFSADMLAEDYIAERAGDRRKKADGGRAQAAAQKHERAAELLTTALAAEPGLSKTRLLATTKGQRVGSDLLEAALAQLITDGKVVVSAGERNAQQHRLAEA